MLQAAKFLSLLNVAQKATEKSESTKLRQAEIEDLEFVEGDVAEISVEPAVDFGFEEGADFIGEAAATSDYYDPYYQPYYYHDDYSWLYSKRRVHNMTWAALAQLFVPIAMYEELTEHSQSQAAVWEVIAAANLATYGPMFLTGVFALSDLLPDAAATYIEYCLSNLYIPVSLYSVW